MALERIISEISEYKAVEAIDRSLDYYQRYINIYKILAERDNFLPRFSILLDINKHMRPLILNSVIEVVIIYYDYLVDSLCSIFVFLAVPS